MSPSSCQANMLREDYCFRVCPSSEIREAGGTGGVQSCSHKASSPSGHSQAQERVSFPWLREEWLSVWLQRHRTQTSFERSELPVDFRPVGGQSVRLQENGTENRTVRHISESLHALCPKYEYTHTHTHNTTGLFRWRTIKTIPFKAWPCLQGESSSQ